MAKKKQDSPKRAPAENGPELDAEDNAALASVWDDHAATAEKNPDGSVKLDERTRQWLEEQKQKKG